MSSNDKIKFQETIRTQSSDDITIPRKSIDPSTEVAEPHLLLEENSFPPSSTIAKDDDFKRINTLIEAIHADTFKKEEQQSQKSSLSLSSQKSVHAVTTVNTQSSPEEVTNLPSFEQHNRRTVTFDENHIPFQSISNRPIRTSNINYRLSNHDSIPNDQQEKESSDTIVGSGQMSLTTQDWNNLLSEDEYIPGGFANLDHELEEELLNDFDDEFDDQTTRRSRYISSIHSNEPTSNISRSPIELWQRARILIAIHLYKIQNKTPNLHGNTLPTSMVIDPSMRKIIDENSVGEFDYLEKLFEQKENIEERKITFGLSIVQQLSLESSQQYQCVDFYDVEQGYIIICNVINSDSSQISITDPSNSKQLQSYNKSYEWMLNQTKDLSLTHDSKLLVYPINKKLSNETQSVEFNCPFQFNFMICIPIYRLILGFINIKNQKSLMVLIGDASRKGVFLSKQEISHHVYSILYIHEASMLFVGCMGRVLLYNPQPLQFTSQPLFISELAQLPFQSMEPVIHICQILTYRSIGLLSHRYFVVWQYIPNQKLLIKFCNPYRYDFIRCLYNSKFDYIIFAFMDGFILIYLLKQMKLIRRYQCHWKMITDLKISQNQSILLSSSMDQMINIWNLETLQHLYQYNTHEEIFQIDVIHENLFYYRSLQHINLFKLNLHTLLFSMTKTKVIAMKLFTDMQRIARITAVLEDYSSVLISPVSGCCLTYVPNIAKKQIKQILHDISRSSIYSLQFDGEIVLYHAHNNPCVAEYKIRTKSSQYTITCMTVINPMRTHLYSLGATQTSTEKSLNKQAIFFGHANGYISLFQGRFAVIESDNSQSDNENLQSSNPDRLSIISDDPNWSELAEDVKDILRMKKTEIRHQNNKSKRSK